MTIRRRSLYFQQNKKKETHEIPISRKFKKDQATDDNLSELAVFGHFFQELNENTYSKPTISNDYVIILAGKMYLFHVTFDLHSL